MDDQQLPPGLDKTLGFSYDEVSGERVAVSWTVDERHLQLYGIVHGGVYCTAVESTASVGAGIWYGDRGKVVGVANHTDFLRAAKPGDRLTATATPIHRGRLQQLWQVLIADNSGRQIARGEVRLQNLAAADAPTAQ
jgi:1,4-dihydroxy-2-naphthoyl-CoA hydrolase